MKATPNFRTIFKDQAERFMSGFATRREGDDHFDAYCAEIRDEQLARQTTLDEMLAHFDANGFGSTYANKSGDRFCVIFQDASNPGKFRYQMFASFGWIDHHTCLTVDEVIYEAHQAGTCLPVSSDTLDRMAGSQEWARGSERLDVITKLNRGQITWAQSVELSDLIDSKYAAMAAA